MVDSPTFRQTIVVGWLAALLPLCGGSALADSSTDRVLEKIAALEARVATLESKNKEYRREAQEARVAARAANDRLLRLSNAALPTKVPSANSVDPAQPIASSWTGAYWGASAGGAATRSRVNSSDRYTSAFAGNPPPNNVIGYDTLGTSQSSSGDGALIDVFAGWNAELSRRFVVGAQFEATAANLNFTSAGTRRYAYLDANGPTGQTAVGDFRPQVASRWIATALLRAGVLINDQTLFYGLGGWSLAQLEARNLSDNPFFQPVETFMSNGWTAGAGIERRLDSNWSVRAEYRYTGFGTKRTNDNFIFQNSNGGTQTYQRQTDYDQSMQAGRIGFAYSFNPLR